MLIVVSLCPDKKTTEPLKGLISSCVTAFWLGPEGFKLQNTVAWPSVPSRCNGIETCETHSFVVTCKVNAKPITPLQITIWINNNLKKNKVWPVLIWQWEMIYLIQDLCQSYFTWLCSQLVRETNCSIFCSVWVSIKG